VLEVKMETLHDLLAPWSQICLPRSWKGQHISRNTMMGFSNRVTPTPTQAFKSVSFTLQVAESRKIWERVMGTHPSPQAYEKTCVLLLGWNKECDDTETASEVSTHNSSQARQTGTKLFGTDAR
jgi:hypothetical protein